MRRRKIRKGSSQWNVPNEGGLGFSAIFDQYVVISRKRCILHIKLLWDSNRKPYAGYRMVSVSMTLSGPWPGFQGQGSFKRRVSPKRRILQTQLLHRTLIGNHRHVIDRQAIYTAYNPTALNRANFSQASRGFVSDSWPFLSFLHINVIVMHVFEVFACKSLCHMAGESTLTCVVHFWQCLSVWLVTGRKADKRIFRIIIERVTGTKFSQCLLYRAIPTSLRSKRTTGIQIYTQLNKLCV